MSDSTESSAYFYRIITLLVDVGTGTLREVFYSKCPKATVATLFSTSKILSEINKLKSKKVLNTVQYQSVTVNPDPETYDISLLITLLINQKICGIPEPATGWRNIPPDTDTTLGADLLRFRDIRNQNVGHRSNVQLKEEEFQALWGNIETILVRIASQVNSTVEADVKQKIEKARTRMLEPLDDREKKLLQVFIEHQKEDAEKNQAQVQDIKESLKDLHRKFDAKHSTDETDASQSVDSLTSLQSQVQDIAQNIGNVAQQESVRELHENVQGMKALVTGVHQMLKEVVDSKQMDMPTQQIQAAGQQPATVSYEREVYNSTRENVVSLNKNPKVTNPNAMSEKEILNLSRQIGCEWEQLRIHLDFTESQAYALKRACDDDVQQRIHQMLKSWHDVVADCGENPRMLLAAAFVNASTNYAMAFKLVPREQFKANAEAKQTTVERIQEITFSRRGFDQGDVVYYHGGHGSFNVYGGNVRLEGTMVIQSLPSSQLSSETQAVQDSGTSSMGSFQSVGQPFKKA